MEEQTKQSLFKKWFARKWAEWDHLRGVRSTQNDLAKYLELSRETISKYVAGSRLPEGDNLKKVARKFGFEVYSLLGIGIPEEFLPPEYTAWISSTSLHLANTIAATNTDPSSDKAKKLAREIVSGSGFTTNNTE
jgi:transcriptional regulator with XRE-family HTH domain